ncbi:hypothetical protein IAT40_002480 [Kwoniella sp. CBS 6097]
MGLLEYIPAEQRAAIERSWSSASPRRRAGIAISTVIALLLCLSLLHTGIAPLLSSENALRRKTWSQTSDYDIVVSHYSEELEMMRDTIKQVSERLPLKATRRVIIYSKGPKSENKEGMKELLDMADEVVGLPNLGREGETYLSHIVRHYETPSTNLAEHTIFMQPHLAWHWVFLPRLERLIQPNTGFVSFGPYINHTCGKDSTGQSFPRMADIYSIFRADLCPPEPVVATWAGQFMVSRQRILENQQRAYANIKAKFHEPTDHWIWKEGWWNNEPSNPTLGHALERSWPMIFNCTDASMAETCGEGHGATCQCLD